MKIVIATVQIPFVRGGAEYLADNLRSELIKRGHEAEIVSTPFNDEAPYFIENQIVASRLYDLSASWGGHIDLCIGLKFPAYYLPHPNKVLWVLHQYRQSYDLFNTEYSRLKDDSTGNEIRKIIINADNQYLTEAKRTYTIAQNVSDRLIKYNGLPSVPLYHPCPGMDDFYNLEYDDYILMPSRISQNKRQKLAVEAMRYVKSDIKLVVLGKPDNEEVLKEFLDEIQKYRVEEKVKYVGFVAQEEKLKLYAKSKAVLFIPKDEDYGYITLEAMAASKAVITARDSGGPLEFLMEEETGLVTDPTPQELAAAMDRIAGSRTLAAKMGSAARTHLSDMKISWDHVVKELTK